MRRDSSIKHRLPRRGAAMVLCMFMTAVILASIGVLSTRTVGHVRHSQYTAWRAAAFAGAETLLAVTKERLESGLPANRGYQGDVAALISGRTPLPKMDDSNVEPQPLEGAPELAWYAAAGTPEGYGSDVMVIVVVAEVHGVHAAVEGIYRRSLGSSELRRVTWRERDLRREGR